MLQTAPILRAARRVSDNAEISVAGRASLAPYTNWLDILQSHLNPYTDADEPDPQDNPRSSTTSSIARQSVRASLIPFLDRVVAFNADGPHTQRGPEDLREPDPVNPYPDINLDHFSPSVLPSRTLLPPFHSEVYSSSPPPIPPQHPARHLFRLRHLTSHLSEPNMAQNSTSDPFVESGNERAEGSTELETQSSAPPHQCKPLSLPLSTVDAFQCTSTTIFTSSLSCHLICVIHLAWLTSRDGTAPPAAPRLVCFESIIHHLVSIISCQSRD